MRSLALLVVGALVLLVAPATQAAVTHVPLFQLAEVPTVGPHGESVAQPGPPLRNMEAMTLDAGHLWVAEGTVFGASRIDEFDAKTGAFIAQPAHQGAPVSETERQLPTCYGYACGVGIAVGHGPGEATVYVAGERHGVSVVSLLDEAGASTATWNGAATPGGSFGTALDGNIHLGTVIGVAADNSSSPFDAGRGNVFVATEDEHGNGTIDVFHPEAPGEEHYLSQIAGIAPGEPFTPSQIAVDEANGDLLVLDRTRSQVDIFEPTGLGTYAFARHMGGPPPGGALHFPFVLGVDGETGDVYVTEQVPSADFTSFRLDQFSPTGTYLGDVEPTPDPYAVVVDPASHDIYMRNQVYGPDVVIPDVTTAPASSVKPENAVLSGTVDADGAGKASCQFDWGTTPALGTVAKCPQEVEGEGAVPVQVTLNGLERGVTYYYRLQASNANGTNAGEAWQSQSFRTPGASLRGESVADVSATAASFGATIDPNRQATSYYFQYGPTSEYGFTTPAPPGEAIGSGSTDVRTPELHVQGLSPTTVYHYRAVVLSEAGPGEIETVYGEDKSFSTQAAGGSFSLPDQRRWELVSPPSKMGAQILPHGKGPIQASTAGDAFVYQTSLPPDAEAPGYAQTETVLATRGAGGGWTSQDISPPHGQAVGSLGDVGEEYRMFSLDLAQAALLPVGSEFTPLSPEASESTSYLRTNYAPGDMEHKCASSCYRPLVTAKPGYADVPQGTAFGEEPAGTCPKRACGPAVEGASPDLSHLVLSSPVQLTETQAPGGAPGVYEWSAGHLRLVGVLPKGEEGPAILAGSTLEAATGVRHAVSADGERVVLEGGGSGGEGLYLREQATSEAAETIRLDAPRGGAGPSAGLSYMTASSDDSRVFFLDSGRLTANSSASGEDLYEYNLSAPPAARLTDLSADANVGEAAEVATVIGASEDGSYVYFVANGVLAEGAKAGALNLYVRHGGTTKTIVALPNPAGELESFYLNRMFARVSPNGEWLAFMSRGNLTGSDTNDAVSGEPDAEVYLYDASIGRLVCASCNPTGARPAGGLYEVGNDETLLLRDAITGWIAASVPSWAGIYGAGLDLGTFYQPRYLSDSGRLFFNSVDALVPQDVNGTTDVYEYEPAGYANPEGKVFCTPASASFAARLDGCVALISSGTSPYESEFMDASETGADAIFMTRSQLVPEDYDAAYDVYDAQECTNAAPCASAPVQPPACTTEASCKAPPTPQPALYGAPASATFSGAGNAILTLEAQKPKSKSKAKVKPKRAKAKRNRRSRPSRCARRKARRRCASATKVRHGYRATVVHEPRRGGR